MNTLWRSYWFCKLLLSLEILTLYEFQSFFHTNVYITRIFLTQQHFLWLWNVIKNTFIFETISFRPKLNNILTFQNLPKMSIFEWKSQTQNFRRNFYDRRIFYTPPKFFSELKSYFWTVLFFESCQFNQNWKKYLPFRPPPKTHILGGGSDTLNGLDFGYVSRRKAYVLKTLKFSFLRFESGDIPEI